MQQLFLLENTAKADYKNMIYLSQDKELMGYRLLDACPLFAATFLLRDIGGRFAAAFPFGKHSES